MFVFVTIFKSESLADVERLINQFFHTQAIEYTYSDIDIAGSYATNYDIILGFKEVNHVKMVNELLKQYSKSMNYGWYIFPGRTGFHAEQGQFDIHKGIRIILNTGNLENFTGQDLAIPYVLYMLLFDRGAMQHYQTG